jgi:NADPH-dependent 2,4-dienoyl-CoA reductase/sulfur reductase-like enzyme
MSEPDVLIVGAGSAGMSAAIVASELGLLVEVVEERPGVGGNLHHRGNSAAMQIAAPYASDHERGRALIARFESCGVTLRTGVLPWRIETDGRVAVAGAHTRTYRPRLVLIATGAMERPVAFPGWTLPGVMGAGAAQLLLKGAGLVPRGDTVLAGSGPLLYLVGWQLLKLGARPKAVLDSARPWGWLPAVPHLPVPGQVSALAQGLRMIRDLKRAGVRFSRVDRIRAEGTAGLDTVVAFNGSRSTAFPADTLLVHEGVVPSNQLSRMAGCAHAWDALQNAYLPVTDEWGLSSNSSLYLAGDCAGIDGGRAAEAKGAITALAMAERLGAISPAQRDRSAEPHRRTLAGERRLRRFLDRLYPPRLVMAGLREPETIVCRCENVTAGQIRAAIADGADGPSKLKAFTRAGMGPCQGRMCGLSIAALLREGRADRGPPDQLNVRPPLKPVPLGEVAGLER